MAALNGNNPDAQVRRWLESIREETEREFGTAARFSLRGRVDLSYGRVEARDLSSERGLIEYAIRFANAEEDPSERQRFFERQAAFRTVPAEAGRLSKTGKSVLAQLRAELTEEQIAAKRAQLRALLTAIHEQRREPAATSSALGGVWALPALRATPHVHLDIHWVITDASAFNSFVAVLLLDKERSFGRDLCRCRLEGCERFFLMQKPETGRPQRLYCARAHMLEAHERKSLERVRKSRARKARRAK